jgi:hypothetical protein
MPVYLADLDASVTDGRLNERDMISLLERLLKTVSTPAACRIARELDISWQDLFVGIRASRHSKVQAFATKRLAQIFDAK